MSQVVAQHLPNGYHFDMIIVSTDLAQTKKIAADLAQKVIRQKPGRGAVVVALEGELGAGKTVFAKAFAKALGIRETITSPTFVILKRYKIKDSQFTYLFHIDAYRLKDYRELESLGIKDILSDRSNIVLIEWAERVGEILPQKHITIHIDHVDQRTRKIQIT